MTKLLDDPRIDPRIKKQFGNFAQPVGPDVSSRAEIIEQMLSAEGRAIVEAEANFFRTTACKIAAPSEGLSVRTEKFLSSPDGNEVHGNGGGL